MAPFPISNFLPGIRCATLGAAAIILAHAPPLSAQPIDPAVKAAFLTKFPGYVTWPAQGQPAAGAPFTICLIGSDPFGKLAESAAQGQQVDGHAVQIRRYPNADAASDCQIAFVQAATGAGLQAFAGKAVLTVTDKGSTEGMIHFEVSAGRVRFRIDEATAQKSGLAINSRLLAIALSVKRAE